MNSECTQSVNIIIASLCTKAFYFSGSWWPGEGEIGLEDFRDFWRANPTPLPIFLVFMTTLHTVGPY